MPAPLDEDHAGVVTDRLGQGPGVVLRREAIVRALDDEDGLVDALAHRAVSGEVSRMFHGGGQEDLHRRAVPPADAVLDGLGRVRFAEGRGHEHLEKSVEVTGGEGGGDLAGRVGHEVSVGTDEGEGFDALGVIGRQLQGSVRPSGRPTAVARARRRRSRAPPGRSARVPAGNTHQRRRDVRSRRCPGRPRSSTGDAVRRPRRDVTLAAEARAVELHGDEPHLRVVARPDCSRAAKRLQEGTLRVSSHGRTDRSGLRLLHGRLYKRAASA